MPSDSASIRFTILAFSRHVLISHLRIVCVTIRAALPAALFVRSEIFCFCSFAHFPYLKKIKVGL
jgi:hypothetical protein